ncbi:interactor protein for cytohesin exchange factors 1-like [Anneissia japonica]|uniref:interactor protein for cytohesin exchange factors 1-like n=1 Tax=Anneissia japonica TaxID=1529436 RepID=UPI0014258E5F|nr:interactor protein for cytohesin exchange factors 1-like [Anneissia japonica]
MICLVGYEVTSEEGKKPNLLKISHKGLKPFIFSAERKKDSDAWLEKMQLVSVTFNQPDVVQESENTELVIMAKDMEGYHSESDDEDSSSVSLSTSGSHQDVDVPLDVSGQRSSSASAGDELLLAAIDSADSPCLKKASSMSLLAIEDGLHTQNGRLPNSESGTLIKSNSFSSLTAHATKPKVKSGHPAASPGVMRRLKKALKSKSNTDIKRSYTTASEYTKHKKNSAPAINTEVDHSNEKQEHKPETKGDVLDFLNVVRDSGTVVRGFGRSSTRSSIKGRDLFRKPTILHRDPTKNKLMLQKRALERTKKAKQTELDIVMKLLSEPLTAAALREWKEINGSILAKDESHSSSEEEQDEEENVKQVGQANGEQEDGKHNGQENGEHNLENQMNCNPLLVVCEQSNNIHEQDGSVNSPEISLGDTTGKDLEISLNTTKSTLETDLDSVDVLRNNNGAENFEDPDDQTDNVVKHTTKDCQERTDNIQGNDLIFVEGYETHL